MSPFCKLADPQSYVACIWDLVRDEHARTWHLDWFRRHFNTLLAKGIDAAVARGESRESAEKRAARAREEFYAKLDAFAAAPGAIGHVDTLTFDGWRDGSLRRNGFPDVFIDQKKQANERMLPLLPVVCAELDAMPEREQVRAVIEGVCAGNIFDLGTEATAKAFMHEQPDFMEIRRKLPRRPWLVDDLDAMERRMVDGPRHRKAVYFIDNAGSDFVLGVAPMARWLARRGTRVVLAANELATLNDMTAGDVRAWWPRVVEREPSLDGLPIECVSTGTGEPLIDLSKVSGELNEAAADADLVVLEGMGRGVESNLDAAFTCDTLNIAMIKDQEVADYLGGRMYDVVCRFRGSLAGLSVRLVD